MGLSDFFKRRHKYNLPDIYEGLIDEKQYNEIIELALQYHQENNIDVTKVEEGELLAEVDGEEQHRYLDNLVRLLSSNDKSTWKDLIYEHFEKIKDHSAAYDYFYKDFEYASQFLRALIKPDDIDLGDDVNNSVYRIDFPETYTFLVLEFENQFRYIRKEDIAEWNISIDELFSIAMENLPIDEIEVKQYQYDDKFDVYIFFSGDYSASLTLDLEHRMEDAIGTYGSLIAIPTKGTSFAHPIESNDIVELIEKLAPSVDKFYNEDPGTITRNFYWYYQGEFEKFPAIQVVDKVNYSMPEGLVSLFND